MTFRAFVKQRFGTLARGSHATDSIACVLEAVSQWKDLPWTDSPDGVGLPDIRLLNDQYYDAARRTRAMIRLVEAYEGWSRWSTARKAAVMTALIVGMVRQVVAELPGLPNEVRRQCREIRTLAEAKAVALAASAALSMSVSAPASAAEAEAALEMVSAAEVVLAMEAGFEVATLAAVSVSALAAVAALVSSLAENDDILDRAVSVWVEVAEGVEVPGSIKS